MTRPTDPERPDPSSPLTAATSDLERLQEVLRRAASGRAGVGEVTEAAARYWSDHGEALQATAAALGEEVRRQMLAELYRMRAQLAQQLQRRPSPAPAQPEEDAGRGGRD